jgi:hypothetical protein
MVLRRAVEPLSRQWGTGLHRYSDFTIFSAFPLPELPSTTLPAGHSPEFIFEPVSDGSPPSHGEWIHHWQAEHGAPALSLARATDGGYLLHFPDLADFFIDGDGRQIKSRSAPGTNDATLRHLLLDQVLPRVIAHRGRVVLHAASVRIRGRVIAIAGTTGAGKSTLAASFLIAGHPLLSDDGLLLDPGQSGTVAQPTYPSLRLWPQTVERLFAEAPRMELMAHYSAKRRLMMNPDAKACLEPAPLAGLYVLAPRAPADTSGITMTRLSPADGCMAIVSNTFQLDVTDRARTASLLAAASLTAQQIPIFSLRLPDDLGLLPDAVNRIVEHASSGASS